MSQFTMVILAWYYHGRRYYCKMYHGITMVCLFVGFLTAHQRNKASSATHTII
jgi:hypothetical protein